MAPCPVKISKNVLRDLAACTERPPAFATERGELFIGKGIPAACIRLKMTFAEFVEYLGQVPEAERPDLLSIIPVEGQAFDLVVIGSVEIDGKFTRVNGRQVSLL